jgi:hypothetical protein
MSRRQVNHRGIRIHIANAAAIEGSQIASPSIS